MPGMRDTMHEFKERTLHSGKGGPVVKSRKQAVAIGMSQMRKAKGMPKKAAMPMDESTARAKRVKDFEDEHGDAAV